ncbi:polyamine ABC transporter ATP-binding protein [Rhodoferax lacus]|uniref:Polyamine ABC transporter ATP-binding protein n=1 Tax=Rhodoferax lacus TaxID=2184758 RepID=A0A3E1RHP0_9BURK|nr:ABC transporter ATP-binding protein [Rhodoferax lacus]RFO98916.1 polyamine ABC transporter ATP-binding protein [Rhodoferax lacus]
MPVAIEFRNVSRHYGSVKALDQVSFQVEEGEFFSMLGPSGSGKTTSLRLMAGFEQPSSGSLQLMGREAAGTPPYARDVNTVFQDYALFPHMSVLDNVAYGLMVRKMDRAQRHALALEALAMVSLPDHGGRTPAQLSGGQRQRVALARALVNRPRVLLLDEPLGALDLKLREQMQVELKVLHRKLGITFVYVTHDQGEALSMSDRIAVFNHGRIEQIASPRELYQRPRTRFVAGFVGSSNVFDAELAHTLCGKRQAFAVRQENMVASPAGTQPPVGHVQVEGELLAVQFLGAALRLEVQVGEQTLTALQADNGFAGATEHPNTQPGQSAQPGQRVALHWAERHMVNLDA